MKTYEGSTGIAPPFLASEKDGGDWLVSLPDRLTPGERAPSTRRTVSWVDLIAGLDSAEKKKIPCRESKLGRPARSPSLYRLTYPSSTLNYERS
jgi:hypothetical protein